MMKEGNRIWTDFGVDFIRFESGGGSRREGGRVVGWGGGNGRENESFLGGAMVALTSSTH